MRRPDSCLFCAYFRNAPVELESAIAGLVCLSSAYGSTRADDGLCAKHHRYVNANARCDDFDPAKERR
jgi:hypothetical protein